MKKNQSLSSKLDNALKVVVNRLEKIENFTIEQAPDLCKEIVAERSLNYGFKAAITGGAAAALVLFGAALSVLTYHLAVLSYNAESGRVSESYGVPAFLLGIIAVIALGFSIPLVQEALNFLLKYQITKETPKLTIVKELKKIIDGDVE